MLKQWRVALVLVVAGLASVAMANDAPRFKAGVHYSVIEKPVAVDDRSKIEVREFFSYTCPHCYDLDPYVQAWASKVPADVNFVHTHVTFMQGAEALARSYNIAQDLGILEQVHQPIFDAIHKHREPLFSHASLKAFFGKFGVSARDFERAYSAQSMSARIRESEAIAGASKITGVPNFTVNGKYLVLRSNLSSVQELFEVIDYLVAQERK